jgi:hypothetical protein
LVLRFSCDGFNAGTFLFPPLPFHCGKQR